MRTELPPLLKLALIGISDGISDPTADGIAIFCNVAPAAAFEALAQLLDRGYLGRLEDGNIGIAMPEPPV
jgi:hypothetical protein